MRTTISTRRIKTLRSFCFVLFLSTGMTLSKSNAQVLINEDFSTANGNTPPTGWTNVANSFAEVWDFSDACGYFNFDAGSTSMAGNLALLSSGCYYFNDLETDNNSDLTSLVFDASQYGTYILEYDNSIGTTGGTQTCQVQVFNGTSWVNVYEAININDGAYSANHKAIDITTACGGNGTTKVRFHNASHYLSYGSWWGVDNVKITRYNCMAPIATFTVVPDCPNNQFSFSVDITSLGSATSLNLSDGIITYGTPIIGPGTYTAGPFNGISQTVTLIHNMDQNCNLSASAMTSCSPPNDTCTNATTIGTNGVVVNGTIINALVEESGLPAPSCNYMYSAGDVWYKFVATATTADILVAVQTAIAPTDACYYGYMLYSGTCGNFTAIDCQRASYDPSGAYGGSTNATDTAPDLTIGATYYVRVFQDYTVDNTPAPIDSHTMSFSISVTSPQGPLNIILKSITAQNEGKQNMVNWTTATEDKGDYFELERSSDSKTFKKIATINAKGIASDYVYYDRSPNAGINYYKLKTVSQSGKAVYSDIVKAVVADGHLFSVNAYPNPAQSTVHIMVSNSENGIVTLSDVTGRIIYKAPMTGTDKDLDLSKVANGIYILNYHDDKNQSKTIKLTKQ